MSSDVCSPIRKRLNSCANCWSPCWHIISVNSHTWKFDPHKSASSRYPDLGGLYTGVSWTGRSCCKSPTARILTSAKGDEFVTPAIDASHSCTQTSKFELTMLNSSIISSWSLANLFLNEASFSADICIRFIATVTFVKNELWVVGKWENWLISRLNNLQIIFTGYLTSTINREMLA